jgi:hypothetical protein
MDTSPPSSAAPGERHYTLQQVMQIVWLSHQFPGNVDFHDPRMAAQILIRKTATDAAAAIKNDLEAIALTLTSESRGNVDSMYMSLSKLFCLR